MLKISDRSTKTCLVVQVEGAVAGDDYEVFSDAFEDAVDDHGTVNLVVELLGGVRYGDFDAVKEDFEFAFEEYKKARRVAFVGEEKMIMRMMKAWARITRVEEGFFAPGELDAAIAWACAE